MREIVRDEEHGEETGLPDGGPACLAWFGDIRG